MSQLISQPISSSLALYRRSTFFHQPPQPLLLSDTHDHDLPLPNTPHPPSSADTPVNKISGPYCVAYPPKLARAQCASSNAELSGPETTLPSPLPPARMPNRRPVLRAESLSAAELVLGLRGSDRSSLELPFLSGLADLPLRVWLVLMLDTIPDQVLEYAWDEVSVPKPRE